MGGWKKKERPLTPEEAIAGAKRDLAPFWYNSEPLLAAVRTEAGASVLPLNSNFVQKAWTYVFVDPTEFAGERALQTAREWHRRYSSHGMGFLIVFRAPLPFAKGAADYLKQFQIQSPGMFDLDGRCSPRLSEFPRGPRSLCNTARPRWREVRVQTGRTGSRKRFRSFNVSPIRVWRRFCRSKPLIQSLDLRDRISAR